MNKVRDWIVDRFALQPIYDRLLDRRVPKAPWYTGDGATLLSLLGIQVVTGAVLALTYSPAADSAHQSIAYITHEQMLGWFVRGLHYWSAGAMMVMLFFHLFRQILFAGYKSPREGTWIIGVLLFFGVLSMAYTGYLLRWDEQAIYGIRVMLHMLARVPGIGESLVLLVQGGPDIGPRTLTRIYTIHVLIIPLKMFFLAGIHLYLVVQHGTITREERRQAPESVRQQKEFYQQEANSSQGERFFPHTMFKTGVMASVVIGVVLLVTLLVGPRDVAPEANLVDSAAPAEEWWFWWYSGLIALLPPTVAPWFVVVFPPVIFLVLMLPAPAGPQSGARCPQTAGVGDCRCAARPGSLGLPAAILLYRWAQSGSARHADWNAVAAGRGKRSAFVCQIWLQQLSPHRGTRTTCCDRSYETDRDHTRIELPRED